ncbi:AAA family ATPase [Pueribacillus sp. YX66]|uniref:AAA family ATPase n=1 Tax=Pueribacillus sp. YX66 TaxID=3229242 RepID=UPI00358D9E45
MNSKSKFATKLTILALIVITGLATISWVIVDKNKGTEVSFAQMEQTIQALNGQRADLTERSDGKLFLKTNHGLYVTNVRPESQMVEEWIKNYNLNYKYSNSGAVGGIMIGGVFIALLISLFVLQGKGGVGVKSMKNSRSKAAPLPNVTLNDIGGLPNEMKEEILQTLSIIKNPKRSEQIGLKAPKGILLYGPPGTGKTLLAQAIAREIGATFFSSSGAAFTELFVGVGAARVRSLFQNARKQKPAVIFIDEIDALAGRRKAHGGGDEGEKTLTELLVQLDGGNNNDGILFIAATNRKDMLDDAFLRPGRIDFTFHVPLPDTQGRKEIIDIHTKDKPLAKDVIASLDGLAESTSGFSGAEISTLFETASRRAVREGREEITASDIDYALDRTILGTSSRALNDKQTKRRVAIHESGHALVAALTKPGSIRKATIIPRGQALGYVAPIPKELHLSTTSELLDQVSMILAGGVAERMYLGEHSIGVSGDVQQAKQIIEQMVDTGMLQDAFRLTFDKGKKAEKMQALFEEALQKTEQLIRDHETEFQHLVDALMKKETLEGEEVQEIVTGNRTEVVS